MTIDRAAILEDILAQPADSSGWLELTLLINSWPESEGLDEALARAEASLAAWPDEVRTGNSWWPMASTGNEPRWCLARSISFGRRTLEISALPGMVDNDAFAQIRSLKIGVGQGPELVDELASVAGDGPGLKHISGLSLKGREIGTRGAQALARLDLPALKHLDVSGCDLGKSGLSALLSADWAGQLQTLNLSESNIDLEGTEALATAELNALRTLNFRRTSELNDGALAALCSGKFPELRELSLEECGFSSTGLAALAGASHWKNLRVLNLWHLDRAFGDDGAKALAENWALPGVIDLNIGSGKIGNKGAKALSKCTGLATVQTLNIARSELTASGMKALANSEALSGVKSIQMNWCKSAAIKAMAGSDLARSIEVLQIPRTGCKDSGLLALLEGEGLARLRHLDLTTDKLTDTAMELLAGAADKLADLRILQVPGNRITEKGLGLLASSGLQLQSLELRANKLGQATAKILGSGSLAGQLRDLNVRGCGLGESGFSALCKTSFPALRKLEIDAGSVTADGLNVMSEHVAHFPALRWFKFSKSLFDPIPKDQLDVLQACFPLGRAALNGGAYAMMKRLPELAKVTEKSVKPSVEKTRQPIRTAAVFDVPKSERPISLDDCSELTVLDWIGMGTIKHVRWLSENTVLIVTANGVFRYDIDKGTAEVTSHFAHHTTGCSDDGRFVVAQLPGWRGGVLDLETGAIETWDIVVQKGFGCMAFSPDNSAVAIASAHTESFKGLLRVRQLASGAQWDLTLDFSASGAVLCWSPDGKHIALGAGNHHAIFTADGQLRASWALGGVESVRFSRDSTRLITGTRKGNMSHAGEKFLRVWDLDGNQIEEIATPHDGMYSRLQAIATHPDGATVAVGGADQHVHLFDSADWRRTHLLKTADLDPDTEEWGSRVQWNVEHLAFSPDGTKLLVGTGGVFGSLQVWNTASWVRTSLHCDFVKQFNDFALSDGGRTIALATTSEARSYISGEPSPVIHGGWKGPYTSEDVDHFQRFADGKRAALTSGVFHSGFTFGILDLETSDLITPFNCKTAPRVLAVRESDSVIATGDDKGRLALWKPGRKTPLAKPERHHQEVNDLAWSTDGNILVSGCDGGILRVWDAASKRERFSHTAGGTRPAYRCCAASADGAWIAGSVSNRPRGGPYTSSVHIFAAEGGAPTVFADGGFNAMVFSPDAKLLVGGDSKGRIRILRTEDAALLAEYQAHGSPVTALQFDPHGHLLYSMTRNGQIKIWGLGAPDSEYLIATYAPVAAAPEAVAEESAPPPPKPVNWKAVEAHTEWVVASEETRFYSHADVGWVALTLAHGTVKSGVGQSPETAREVGAREGVTSESITPENLDAISRLVEMYVFHRNKLSAGGNRMAVLRSQSESKTALAELGGTSMRLFLDNGAITQVELGEGLSLELAHILWEKASNPFNSGFEELPKATLDSILSAVAARGDEQKIVFDPPLVPPEVNWKEVEAGNQWIVEWENKRLLKHADLGWIAMNMHEGRAIRGSWQSLETVQEVAAREGVGSDPMTDENKAEVAGLAELYSGHLADLRSGGNKIAVLLNIPASKKTLAELGGIPMRLLWVDGNLTQVTLDGDISREISDAMWAKASSKYYAPLEELPQVTIDAILATLGKRGDETTVLFEPPLPLPEPEPEPEPPWEPTFSEAVEAVHARDVDLVRRILETKSTDARSAQNGWNLLHESARHGVLGAVRLSIEGKCDVNQTIPDGYSPLFLAFECACENMGGESPERYAEALEVVELLLESGADPTFEHPAINRQMSFIAAEWGCLDLTKRFMQAADYPVDTQDEEGETSLSMAVWEGQRAIVQFLLAEGADPNLPNNAGYTPLHQAAVHDHGDIAADLLDAGADKTSVLTSDDEDFKVGMTPAQVARVNDYNELADRLEP